MNSCGVTKSLKPSDLENIAALRDLLNSSAFRALNTLSKLNSENPYAALPSEFQPVIGHLKTLGMGEEIDRITNDISRIIGVMLDEANIIMADAIKEVKFNDTAAIILGGQDAATQVLRNNMKIFVKNRYRGQLNQMLYEHDINTYWPMAARVYNTFSRNKIDSNLSDLLSETAVDAIFMAMGKQETELRNDPKQIGTDVALKVFEYYEKHK